MIAVDKAKNANKILVLAKYCLFPEIVLAWYIRVTLCYNLVWGTNTSSRLANFQFFSSELLFSEQMRENRSIFQESRINYVSTTTRLHVIFAQTFILDVLWKTVCLCAAFFPSC